MLSLLEQSLAETDARTGSPVIVSENHDLNSIDWAAGMSDPGEMIGCGMYQQLRRTTGETDEVYKNRLVVELEKIPVEHKEKILRALIESALNRASYDVTGGKVALMVAGEPPWSKLGVNVKYAVNSSHAISLGGLNWRVYKVQNTFTGKDDKVHEAVGSFSIVREDTNEHLGNVGRIYKSFQNEDAFKFLDSVLEDFGAKYESCGSLYGGKKVFMCVRLPEHSFKVTSNDAVDIYGVFSNPHDGSGVGSFWPTSFRPVCANTLRLASRDKHKGISLRHSTNLDSRVEEAKKVLGITIKKAEQFKTDAEQMVATKVEPISYFNGVLDMILEVKEAEVKQGAASLAAVLAKQELWSTEKEETERDKIQKDIDNRRKLFDDVMSRYESPNNGVDGIRGTGWSCLNTITEASDHGLLGGRYNGEQDAKLSRRFESIMEGDSDEIKQVAYDVMMNTLKK